MSLGDGQWGVETTGHDSGFCSLEYGPLVDFVGPHVYRMEHDRIRQHLKAAFICELAAVADRPVIMEEFGLSSDFASPQASAAYYRQLLHATLAAGATGWIAWNNTDYDNIKDQRPYSHHPFELHFGITDHRGRPKPPLKELEIFSEELRDIDFGGIERARTDTAIIVPSYLAARYPFTEDAERVLIPHPAIIPDLDDLREFAAELSLSQRFDQLFREVHRPDPANAERTQLTDWSGGAFDQLRFATGRAASSGFKVSGGYAVCPVYEDGALITARYWIGADAPDYETETGDLHWVRSGDPVPIGQVGPVAYSEGVRMATRIYAGRKPDKTEGV